MTKILKDELFFSSFNLWKVYVVNPIQQFLFDIYLWFYRFFLLYLYLVLCSNKP